MAEVRKNVHQQHIEDLVLFGVDGLKELNNKIEGFVKTIHGEDEGMNITSKIDGAPAVLVGHNVEGYPSTFVGIKSVLTNPKNAYSSEDEIDAKFGDRPNMTAMLKYCLQLAKYIPNGEIWQGDCLFVKNTLEEREINGQKYITFQPNKFIYAFPINSDSANKILNADFGICFHTRYKKSGETWSQSFKMDQLDVPDNFYIMSLAVSVGSKEEYDIKNIEKLYNELIRLEQKLINNQAYADLVNNRIFKEYFPIFENHFLSDKKQVNLDPNTVFDDLRKFIIDREEVNYNKKLATLKTDAGKAKAKAAYEAEVIEAKELVGNNKALIDTIVKIINCAANIKMIIYKTLRSKKQDYSMYLRRKSTGEYIDSDGEGISISDKNGNIVKLVDRSTFSNANRDPDIESGFDHNESLDESVDTIKLVTVQGKDVLDKLNNGEAYYADSNNILYKDYKKQYENLSKLLGLEHLPIFCAPIDNEESIDASGDIRSNRVKFILNVPRNEAKLTDYYQWSDYLYYSSGQEYDNYFKFNAKQALDNIDKYVVAGEADTPQYVIDRIEPEWVEESLDEKIVKKGSQWQVQSEKGRNMGTYDTKAEAKKRLGQIEYFKHKNEDLGESMDNKAVLIWGRMNPITKAHVAMIEYAKQFGDLFVYLSHSQDSKKNPLPYDRKIYWAQKAVGDYVKESDAKVIIQALKEIEQAGYKDLVYVCGSDRYEEMTTLLNKYNNTPDKNGNINYSFDSIDVKKFGEDRVDEANDIKNYSASLARQLVKEGKFKEFSEVVPFEVEDAKKLFIELRKYMSADESLIDEAMMGNQDITKHDNEYYNKVIYDLHNNGVLLKDKSLYKISDKNITDELINLNAITDNKEKADEFYKLAGIRWSSIDKSPYSGKGGENGQSAGENAEPAVSNLYNEPGNEISLTKLGDAKWVESTKATVDLINSRWPRSEYIAAHVNGRDVSELPGYVKAAARLFKSKQDAAKMIGLDPRQLNNLYSGGYKDNWNKADIILVRKNFDLVANLKSRGVNNTESFNKELNKFIFSNDIVPISLKKLGNDPTITEVGFNRESEKIKINKVTVDMPKEIDYGTNNCSVWLIGNDDRHSRIQFRRQSGTFDNLSIEVVYPNARGGKATSKVKEDLGVSGNEWYENFSIKSEKDLISELDSIFDEVNYNGAPAGAENDDKFKWYNRTCFRGLLATYNLYYKKTGNNCHDFFNWIYSSCTEGTSAFYLIK